ncbi:hypothetical protein FNH22_03480 [Fulvivirga sp. M361]|uniref:coiled-coil domain-containing protein n=1 Tax=Fulvivirga sp. M361 TaxID=2594266 RepID=UPI001179D6B4|nr:hypothetical protein [Fulvivirga sp. M361]TRX61849.1 hypothetical protein FNH22_03480 [Fulvivirga sp. M361]
MEETPKSKDWISVSTVSSVSGLSGSIWLVTNFSYSLSNYIYTFSFDGKIDKTLFCLLLSLGLAVVLVPKIIHKFFPPIEDRTIRSFVIALNIILVISSANGLQTGFSAISSGGDQSVKKAEFFLFDSDPWLKPKGMKKEIEILKTEKEVVRQQLKAANQRIDSLNKKIGVETDLGAIEDFDDRNEFLLQSVTALEKTNQRYLDLINDKSDSITTLLMSFSKIKQEYKKQFSINKSYDSLLRLLKRDIELEKLRKKQINDRMRKIDSLDRLNEH